MYNREEAAVRAEKFISHMQPGMCQLWTRTIFGAPSAGDRDRDGDADAVDGWRSEPEAHRHPGDRKPPRGTPVSFGGGSRGYGHRAVSIGNGKLRSTDVTGGNYTPGKVGTTTIKDVERVLHVTYLGWSNTITGQVIPLPAPLPPPSRGSRIDEALTKLQQARRRSEKAGRTRLLTKAVDALKKIKPTR